MLKFSQCMRSHGVPNWPDPTLDSDGEPLFNITVPRPPPPQVSIAINECERLQPRRLAAGVGVRHGRHCRVACTEPRRPRCRRAGAPSSLRPSWCCWRRPAAAPSSTGSPQAGGSVASPSAVAYSDCMRSHGVPNYPDPASGGHLPKGSAQQLGVSNSQLQAAEQACQHLFPTAGSIQQLAQECFNTGACPQAVVQQALNVMREVRPVHALARGAELPPTPPSIPRDALFSMSAALVTVHALTAVPTRGSECERLTARPRRGRCRHDRHCRTGSAGDGTACPPVCRVRA